MRIDSQSEVDSQRLANTPHVTDARGGRNMEARPRTMQNDNTLQIELHRLREQLDEAWWHEAPLERIQELEQKIQDHRLRLRRPAGQAR